MSQVINTNWNRRNRTASNLRSTSTAWARSRQMSIALTIIVSALVLGATVSFYRQTRAELRIALQKKQEEAQLVENLNAEISRTQDEIQKLKNDPEVIESVARERLGLVRPGDVVIRIPSAGQSQPTQSGQAK